jgi:hypothetical protein
MSSIQASTSSSQDKNSTAQPKYDLVNIFSFSTNIPIASIPLILIQKSGLNSWGFVIDVLRMLPGVDPNDPCEIWTQYGRIDPSWPVLEFAGPYTLTQQAQAHKAILMIDLQC